MKYKIIFLVFLTFACIQSKGQKHANTNLIAIIDSLAGFNAVALEPINPDGNINQQYALFNKLLVSADTSILLELFEEKENEVVRCYIFWELARKQYSGLFPLLTKNLHDNRYVAIRTGGFKEQSKVSDFFINVMTDNKIDVDVMKLNTESQSQLDSILLFDDSVDLEAKVEILRDYIPVGNQRKKIKELAELKYSPFAVVALAKFNDENDLGYIDSLLLDDMMCYYALLAIREFPHKKFYDALLAKFSSIIKAKKIDYPELRACYQALAQYPTEQTVEWFELALKKTKGFKNTMHKKYMWLAIDKYPDNIFHEVKAQLELTDFEKEELEGERGF